MRSQHPLVWPQAVPGAYQPVSASFKPLPLTIYSTGPSCVQCKATYRKLDEMGIPYNVVNLPDHPEVAERLKADGIQQAPYVVVPFEYEHPEGKWQGYQPDMLKLLPNLK